MSLPNGNVPGGQQYSRLFGFDLDGHCCCTTTTTTRGELFMAGPAPFYLYQLPNRWVYYRILCRVLFLLLPLHVPRVHVIHPGVGGRIDEVPSSLESLSFNMITYVGNGRNNQIIPKHYFTLLLVLLRRPFRVAPTQRPCGGYSRGFSEFNHSSGLKFLHVSVYFLDNKTFA